MMWAWAVLQGAPPQGEPQGEGPQASEGAPSEVVPSEVVQDYGNRIADAEVVTVGGDRILVGDLVVIFTVILAAFLISRLIQRGMSRSFESRKLDEGTLHVAQRLTHYVVMTIGVFVGFKLGNIDLTGLFAAGALFAVVIGFAMQNISENFVSGVILMVERSIKPSDLLEIDGRMVRVVRMGIRATVARTRDEEELIIPNSEMVRNTVKNYTLGDRLYRLRTRVGVVYSSDMRVVREVLEKTARNIPFRAREMEPRVLMWEFGNSSVDWDVSVWMENPWHEQMARSELNEAIWNALKDAGITIAFPQLDLHLDPGVEKLLEQMTRRA
jgi:small-conductance mechanosensitive channel